jgi:hypothetical protein
MPAPLNNPPGPKRVERAERISDETWEKHRPTIKTLYLDENVRLGDLKQRMEKDFGFKARQVLRLGMMLTTHG